MQGERKTQRPDSARGRYVKEVKGWHLVWFVFFSPRLKMQSLERSFGCSYVLHSFKRSTTRGLCRCVCACRSSRARLPGLCSTVCGAGRVQGRALAAFPKPRPCNLVPLLSEELPAAISMWDNSNAALPCPGKNPSVAAVPQPAAAPSPWLTLQGAQGWLPAPVCSRAGTGRAGFKDLSQKYTSVRHC